MSLSLARAAAQAAVNHAQANINAASLAFQQGASTFDEWFDAMQVEIVNMAGAQVVLANGGDFAEMTAAQWQRAANVAARQLDYFANFADAVATRGGVFRVMDLRTAGMYADAGRSAYENERAFAEADASGATMAEAILGASDSCPGCIERADLGKIPLQEMLENYPIGSADCLTRCHCVLIVS